MAESQKEKDKQGEYLDDKEIKKLNEEKHKDIKTDEGKDSNTRDKVIDDDKKKIEQYRQDFSEDEQNSKKGYSGSNKNDADMFWDKKTLYSELKRELWDEFEGKIKAIEKNLRGELSKKKEKSRNDVIDDAWDELGK